MDGHEIGDNSISGSPAPKVEQPDTDWRSQLSADARERIVLRIMDILKKHLPFCRGGFNDLHKIAAKFEEKIYTDAQNQSDYLRKISVKMMSMEKQSQTATGNSSNAVPHKGPQDPAPDSMQSQQHNEGQSFTLPLSQNQMQPSQRLLPPNTLNISSSAGVQNLISLPASMPLVTSLNPTLISSTTSLDSNLQNLAGASENTVGTSMGQGMSSHMHANSQRQLPGRQHSQQAVSQQQQQQQQQESQMYQQQLQHQLLKKFQQVNIPSSALQSHMQQQLQEQEQQQQHQQQNLSQSTQLQNFQQPIIQTSSIMKPTTVQSIPLSSPQQNPQTAVQQSMQSVIQQHPLSVHRQQQQYPPQTTAHQQQTTMQQQPILGTQQQQQLISQQPNHISMQQNQSFGQPNGVPDVQMQQQQQRLLNQHNNLVSLQQQQQLICQQNSLSNMHQKQLGSKSGISGLQRQQQVLGTQSSNSMQANQHSVLKLQSKVPVPQQSQPSASTIMQSQGQQLQSQPLQQELQSQMQSQPTQLQQHMNSLQQDMQQRIQTSGSLLQQQNVIDQQDELLQQQIALPEASSTSIDSTSKIRSSGVNWLEETYQKIKAMKEMYLPDLSEVRQKIAVKLRQHESLPQPPKMDEIERLKFFKGMTERMIHFLQLPKNSIEPGHREKLGAFEKQIIHFLNSANRSRMPPSTLLQQGQQLHRSHVQTVQQPQSQTPQVQSHENQMSPQLQPMTLQLNKATDVRHDSPSTMAAASTPQHNMMNSLQPTTTLDSGMGGSTLRQNLANASQQARVNTTTSQSAGNMLQPNVNQLQANSGFLQQQHLKHQQEQQLMQSQQLKQLHQRQVQQQMMQQKQNLIQQHQPQLHQQTKQQQPSQIQQMRQVHQMNEVNDLRVRQMGSQVGAFPQHHSAARRTTYHQQPLKSGSLLPISSPQLLQPSSPQIRQNSSPQIDQPKLLTKAGSPSQSATSSFVVPSPSTPMAPSPMLGDSEKLNTGVFSLANAGNVGHQQTTCAPASVPSLTIATPGMSASPLLAEFSPMDENHDNASTIVSCKLSSSEQPVERLMKVVKSISHEAFSSSVSDIVSLVGMFDRLAGSASGNGSKAAVGEDLVAITNCCFHARNFVTQDGSDGTIKLRCITSGMPFNEGSSAGSVNDSFKHLRNSDTPDLVSSATSGTKRPRIEANHALLEEIREINRRLVDTVVDISNEGVDPTAAVASSEAGEGTTVKCSFGAVAVSPNLESQHDSAQISPIQPLHLLIPSNYPNCSPILLDKFSIEVSKEDKDLSVKAKSRFSRSLRSLSEPMSLAEMARTWDVCARAVISEYAEKSGGGSFRSRYGTWENGLSAT